MSTIQGGKAGSIANFADQTSQKVQAIKPISQENTSFTERTKGSVFDKTAGNFTALTLANKIPPDNTSIASKPLKQRASANIGNLLAGNFGSLTSHGRNGAITTFDNSNQERNKAQDATKTSDEMLEIANNLTMKDMWQAA